ncbi:MAG: NfeD family protein [Peptoniphilaceae bacterium]|nr:hypothetical protein [Peptoniphilaceae bacterium]MDD7383512.1 NfeD family protein [Peptoniphilaceae bacterium]MDY3738685.1 NfeD family protein [Peptoniphilaceae bacterium]
MNFNEIAILLFLILAFVSSVFAVFTLKRKQFAIISFISYFVFTYLTYQQNEEYLFPIILFVLGILLLTFEIFIPGFGVFGVSGIVLCLYSLFVVKNLIPYFAIAGFIAFLLCFVLMKFGYSANLFNHLILNNTLTNDAGFNSNIVRNDLIDKIGITKSPLRPFGKIEIDGEIFDATTDGEFIDIGKKVKVSKLKNSVLKVKIWEE